MPIVWALVAIMIVFGLIDLVDDLHSQYSDTLDSLLDNNPIKIPLSDVTLNSDTRPVRSSSSSSSNTLNRDKYYAKKFSSRSNSLGTAAVGLPSVKSRISTLDCRPKQFTCLIKNLYFINKEFHVYVGSNFELAKLSNVLDSTILTGIGFGSHSIRFRMADSSSSSFSQNIESETLNLSNFGSSGGGDQAKNSAGKHDSLLVDTTQIHYINIHTTLPPESDELPENIDYYLEPTSFFSVLWSNLFRTIYAGVGAWYTQMSYNVFFTEHHRFVLIENNQKSSSSSKFTRILQAVTQFPVWNLDTLGDCIFRAGVMGIDRDVQVGEINNELGHDEYRFHLRSVAFRSFCDHLKEQILDKPLTSVQHRLFHSLVDGIQDTKDKISHLNSNSPRVSLILRKGGGTRQLLNDGELITALSNLPIKLKVYEFDKMSLRQQIHAIDKTDILIAMHGAGKERD